MDTFYWCEDNTKKSLLQIKIIQKGFIFIRRHYEVVSLHMYENFRLDPVVFMVQNKIVSLK